MAIHSAIAEVGILYATATVHAGWEEVGSGEKEQDVLVYSFKGSVQYDFFIEEKDTFF